jgi:hypothetical protein
MVGSSLLRHVQLSYNDGMACKAFLLNFVSRVLTINISLSYIS